MTTWHCSKCWKSNELFWTNSKQEAWFEACRQHTKVSPDCNGNINVHMRVTDDEKKLAKMKSPSLFEN